jgi:hypothetical protein
MSPGGQLIITSPYSWLEEFTSSDFWIHGNCLEAMKGILKDHFSLQRSFDLPFLMREHLRKYQWGVAQATIWHCNKRI